MTRTPRQFRCLLLVLAAPFVFGCTGGVSGSSPTPSAVVQVSVSPTTASIRAGDTYQFTAIVSGASNPNVTWSVNNTPGGNSAYGTITSFGVYTAPSGLPTTNQTTVMATSAADSTARGVSDVTLLNPTPVLSAISPSSVPAGNFTISVAGSKFVSGSQVLFGSTPLQTNVVSASQLTASGSASSAGTYAIIVRNPDPGSTTSSSMNLQVISSTPPPPATCNGMSLGQNAGLNGFRPFPDTSPWNLDISAAFVDPNSAAIINFIGPNVAVHPDFGAGLYQGSWIGIPYVIVNAPQGGVRVNFTAYGSESDPGPMPIPANAPVEGGPNPTGGDRHVLVLDNSNCFLYELFGAAPAANGAWNADSAAVWDLLSNEQRPYTWTSADAAGLPIFPGLVRYDEVAAGEIRHAIRFTLAQSRAAIIPPASHWAANSSNALAAPMGMRLRLKAGFNISGYSAANQVILRAMKKYGLLMADNGSSMFISGAPDDRWDNNDLHLLQQLHASDFEVIQMNPVYTSANLPRGSAPQISSFTSSTSSVAPGTPVTLSWQVTGASYLIISPQVGPVRGTSVTVAPTQTTTYTLTATNAFDRSTLSLTVTVP